VYETLHRRQRLLPPVMLIGYAPHRTFGVELKVKSGL
jgi:hypothetical protein